MRAIVTRTYINIYAMMIESGLNNMFCNRPRATPRVSMMRESVGILYTE